MKPQTKEQQHRANLKTAIAKLEKRGVTFGKAQGPVTVAQAICDLMAWAPREPQETIDRFVRYQHTAKATGPYVPRARQKLDYSKDLAMQRAYERAGTGKFITLESK